MHVSPNILLKYKDACEFLDRKFSLSVLAQWLGIKIDDLAEEFDCILKDDADNMVNNMRSLFNGHEWMFLFLDTGSLEKAIYQAMLLLYDDHRIGLKKTFFDFIVSVLHRFSTSDFTRWPLWRVDTSLQRALSISKFQGVPSWLSPEKLATQPFSIGFCGDDINLDCVYTNGKDDDPNQLSISCGPYKVKKAMAAKLYRNVLDILLKGQDLRTSFNNREIKAIMDVIPIEILYATYFVQDCNVPHMGPAYEWCAMCIDRYWFSAIRDTLSESSREFMQNSENVSSMLQLDQGNFEDQKRLKFLTEISKDKNVTYSDMDSAINISQPGGILSDKIDNVHEMLPQALDSAVYYMSQDKDVNSVENGNVLEKPSDKVVEMSLLDFILSAIVFSGIFAILWARSLKKMTEKVEQQYGTAAVLDKIPADANKYKNRSLPVGNIITEVLWISLGTVVLVMLLNNIFSIFEVVPRGIKFMDADEALSLGKETDMDTQYMDDPDEIGDDKSLQKELEQRVKAIKNNNKARKKDLSKIEGRTKAYTSIPFSFKINYGIVFVCLVSINVIVYVYTKYASIDTYILRDVKVAKMHIKIIYAIILVVFLALYLIMMWNINKA